ncbi:MAG TPA: TIGR01212 family radical SAM protein [Thiobacillaceae bacterium]|nr:TIGR01212 family radical SAM protein [Thiobacillaceae bacterium]
MQLTDYVHTFGQHLLARHGERVHKIALNAGFTCPNRDGSKGIGGCTFCNNASFSPNGRAAIPLEPQLDSGRRGIARRTRARKYLAYFQAYTNTYAEVAELRRLYDQALGETDVIGLAVGTRPDCVPVEVLDLLAEYRDRGHEVWLELGLQSAFDDSLARVNRGHGWREYEQACRAARARGLPVCCHLIVGLPGETCWHALRTLDRVLDTGVEGLKLHPLHVVKGTQLANEWRRGEYAPLAVEDYVAIAADLIERTPWEVVYHRITGTAPAHLLLAPEWCSQKWPVVNAVVAELARRGSRQGTRVSPPQQAGEGDPEGRERALSSAEIVPLAPNPSPACGRGEYLTAHA